MGILTPQKEVAWQLYFRDDGAFIFRKLDIEDGWLVEKDGKQQGIRAFMLQYKLQERFDGYKNIPAGNITLGFGRDILFDPFVQLSPGEAPEKGIGIKKKWMAKIAEAKVHRLEQTAKATSIQDKTVMFMGIVALILALAIGLKVAVNRSAKPHTAMLQPPAIAMYQERQNWTI